MVLPPEPPQPEFRLYGSGRVTLGPHDAPDRHWRSTRLCPPATAWSLERHDNRMSGHCPSCDGCVSFRDKIRSRCHHTDSKTLHFQKSSAGICNLPTVDASNRRHEDTVGTLAVAAAFSGMVGRSLRQELRFMKATGRPCSPDSSSFGNACGSDL